MERPKKYPKKLRRLDKKALAELCESKKINSLEDLEKHKKETQEILKKRSPDKAKQNLYDTLEKLMEVKYKFLNGNRKATLET